jgi:hypothetical protein
MRFAKKLDIILAIVPMRVTSTPSLFVALVRDGYKQTRLWPGRQGHRAPIKARA